MSAKDYRGIVLAQMHATLKQHAFRKTGALFSSEQRDTVLFVQLQSSVTSTKDVLVVTLNLGIFSRTVAASVGNTHVPNIMEAHWRKRIGEYLPQRSDKWWEIQSESDTAICSSEITELLTVKVLPEMQSLASTDSLKSLWSSGLSPGLTNFQRQQYLQALAARS